MRLTADKTECELATGKIKFFILLMGLLSSGVWFYWTLGAKVCQDSKKITIYSGTRQGEAGYFGSYAGVLLIEYNCCVC